MEIAHDGVVVASDSRQACQFQFELPDFFAQYFSRDNWLLQQLSQPMRKYLANAFSSLRRCVPEKMTPAMSGDINSLWRFITANLWLEANL